MHDQLQFHVGSTSQSAARVYFSMRDGSKTLSAEGKLVGPYCKQARTLPAEFSVVLSNHPANQQSIAETMILDPCYWSPKLPYTYEAELQLQLESGQIVSYRGPLGMRPWHCRQKSFYLASRRTVLRGYHCHEQTEQALINARDQEVLLLIDPANQQFFQSADHLGISLIVDLRKTGEALNDHVHRLNWSPSVKVVMVNAKQLAQIDKTPLPRQCLLAQCLTADSQQSEIIETNPEVLAIEFDLKERPPEWISKVGQPVVAIRRGVAEDHIQEPRRSCDMLQASLAPEFNLAGYIVSP